MAEAWFVSDVHLLTETDARGFQFIAFLDRLLAKPPSHLFLVGDIFDLWIASHRYFVERFQRTIGRLKLLHQRGCEIHLFEGNHDLYLHGYFCGELGLTVHSDPAVFDLAGLRVRVEHGDQIDPEDRGYRFLRWLLRTPFVTFLAKHLPGSWVAAFGEFLSRRSRTYTSTVKAISDVATIEKLHRHAARAMEQTPFDLLVSGHVHVRDDFRLDVAGKAGRAINLGTWIQAAEPKVFCLTPKGGLWVDVGHEN